MLCSEIMRKDVECCFPDSTCQSAAVQMRDRDIGFVPVCEHDTKRLVGTLTDRDIVIRLLAFGGDVSTPIEKIMTRECITCLPEDDVRVAAKLMGQHQITRMLCVDDRGTVCGVISSAELIWQTESGATVETFRKVKAAQAHA